MKATIQFVLAGAVLSGAASSAVAGANDRHENGNDRYPWLSDRMSNGRP